MNKKVIGTAILTSLLVLGSAIAQDHAAPQDGFEYGGSGAVLLGGPWERSDGVDAPETPPPGGGFRLPARPGTPDFAAAAAEGTTYRMAIRIASGDPARRMGVFIPATADVTAVYANGDLLYDKGRGPASPPLLLADAPSGSLSLALCLESGARPLESASSFPPFVLFGDAESVGRARIALGTSAAFLDGYFILMGLFVLALFLFRRENREFLAFSIFLFVQGAAFLAAHAVLFGYATAAADRLEAARLAFLGLGLLTLAFLLGSLFRVRLKAARRFAYRCACGALAALTSASVVVFVLGGTDLPLRAAIGPLYAAVEGCAALFALGVVATLAILAAKRDDKARWLLPAFVVLVAASALGRFGPATPLSTYLAPLAGAVVFSAAIFLMLVKNLTDGLESSEALSDYVASISRAVKSFIPKEFLEHLQKDNLVDLRLGDHAKKEMTIFFSDIRAFTQLSEELTVEENFAFINSYLSRVVPVIKENGGFVDKYVGDGIMALFPGPKGPDEAIRAAIAMQEKMVEYNGHRAKVGYRPISMGVGVHTGDLMLGVVGVEERMENTVISDAVNLSSRLQAITKAFNISLAISEKAFKELEDPGVYKYRFIGKVKVKGKAAPVSVFEIFDGIEPDLFERKMKANMFFEQGMLAYYQKDFAGAMYFFRKVLDIIPEDGAAGFYLDNCMNRANL